MSCRKRWTHLDQMVGAGTVSINEATASGSGHMLLCCTRKLPSGAVIEKHDNIAVPPDRLDNADD